MANIDNPNGFKCIDAVAGEPTIKEGVLATSQVITKGDALVISSGQLAIGLANSGLIHGVAAETKTTTGSTASLLFYPADHNNRFEAQCSGTYSAALVGTTVDIEGATGAMEVNENATTEQVFQIQGAIIDGVNEIGANTRVYGDFVRSSYLPNLVAL